MRITKLLAAVIGVPMAIAGLAMTVAGGIALAVPDDNGWISAGPVRMRTEAVGFVGDDLQIDLGDHVGDGRTFIGWEAIPARLDVDSRNGKEIFVGIATTADAQSYLAGVAIDRVETLHDEPDLVQVQGASSVAPPETQDFWAATNAAGTVDWSLSEGDWSVVVLNSDGSAGVDVAVTGSARIPFLGAVGVVLIALGIIGMAFGTLLTYFGVRAVRPPTTPPDLMSPQQPLATG